MMKRRLATEISDVNRMSLSQIVRQPEVPGPLGMRFPQYELAKEAALHGMRCVTRDRFYGKRSPKMTVKDFTVGGYGGIEKLQVWTNHVSKGLCKRVDGRSFS
jgi:hypothetical protein